MSKQLPDPLTQAQEDCIRAGFVLAWTICFTLGVAALLWYFKYCPELSCL